ncbi:ABC transporter ATP-binding protein [Glaciimonas sp. CA11.2]|uniref:ABC transporter ATP-binding protein n=1 Tax=unclassified Glaciimonas TaxID=2644401 RepID=UPI002AB4D3E6|nr:MULTISPECIES: ABC transporter ATP-binding protein [unclassified Glaciimonas]MDY7545235.1 ABC transporter ATP-binding protein [Glaciimonas sp. CA11.2]MEB0011251.1 ABC transporter ATP-binding protein [Glaciimonas sp. Cout2]MEB0080901.1 ABC transporter ATP-binding protein [Glaciimonas sp. Gout2]MEB0161628.1 ABC transporter ATP-binding protein [Glaciimonas sp. CA11.2]
MTNAILQVEALCSGYSELPVLHGMTLDVGQGEFVSVVGANGAGKTTLLLTITGHLKAHSGRVMFDGQDITNLPAHAAAERGLVMVPEGGRLFPFMSVLENLQLGAYHPKARARMAQSLDEVMTLFPLLAERRTQLAGRLSGGERQMCAVARAMMALPKLLMLDEPSLGLAPIMVDKVFEIVSQLVATKGISVLLVEQNVGNALRMCQRGCIIEHGRILKIASGKDLLQDPDIQRSYMGL